MALKAFMEDVMYGRRKSLFMGGLLSLIALCYGFMVFMRGALYAVGAFRKRKLPQRVISVGNLTLGGTGKTPAVIHIASLLEKNGKHPVVVSRGYGRKDPSAIVVVSDGQAVFADSKDGGDEPALIAAKLPGVPVVVGSDRYRAGLVAGQAFSPDTLILDDGFQHVRLRRDLDIVLVDATDPFGNGKLFPAGILREPLSALKRADVVLITRSDEAGERTGPLKARIRRYTKAPVFSSAHRPVDLMNAATGEIKTLSALRGLPILAFSGIARPALFTSLLASLGAEVKAAMVYPDHYAYRKADMEALFQKAAEVKAAMIITTEKDAARLKSMNPDGIWALRIELHVDDSNSSEWERMILWSEPTVSA